MDQHAFTLVILCVLVESNFESTGGARISVDVVGELSRMHFLDLCDRSIDLRFVASATAVLELNGMGSSSVNFVFRHFL